MTKKEATITQQHLLNEAAELIIEASTILENFNRDTVEPEMSGVSAADAARFQKQLMDTHEMADSLKSTIGKVYDWVRTGLVPEKMDEEGLELLKIEGIGRVSLTSDINVSIINKDEEFKWLEESGHGDLITETVNASSLKALLRRMIRDGKEVPEAIFKVIPFTRASITKS